MSEELNGDYFTVDELWSIRKKGLCEALAHRDGYSEEWCKLALLAGKLAAAKIHEQARERRSEKSKSAPLVERKS